MRFFISRFFTLFNDIISCAPRNNFFLIRDYWHWASEMWQGLRVKPFPNQSNCQHMRHCISLRWAISARCSPLIRLTAVVPKRFEHTLCKASILWNLDQYINIIACEFRFSQCAIPENLNAKKALKSLLALQEAAMWVLDTILTRT